jgi:hypothetical protein
MRRVLVAYTQRNPLVGYCQGMNMIVARILNFVSNEEDAFWTFAMLIESVLPLDFYSSQMIGVQIDIQVFEYFLKHNLPEIDSKLKSLKIDPMMFLMNWFVCIFCDKFAEEVTLAILDFIFLQGGYTIHGIALSILKIIEDVLMDCTEQSKIFYELISAQCRSF